MFGPVITRVSNFSPSEILTGTAFLGSSNGWRAFLSRVIPSLFKIGFEAFILYARCAFAKIKSSCTALS